MFILLKALQFVSPPYLISVIAAASFVSGAASGVHALISFMH